MIFQEPMTALNPVMRCGDQIDEVLATHTQLPAAERRAKVLDIVRAVQLPDPERMIASYPHQLSGGQRQRIMIAMALVLEPALLIADEPTTALDVTTQAQILALIRELQREHGTGVLFITHDFGVVAEIADRVAVLRLGELVEIGPTRELLHGAAARVHEDADRRGAEPRRRGTARSYTAPVGAAGRGLDKTYAQRGWFGGRARGRGGDRRELRHPARRDAGHRRRIGFRQVDRRALHRAADRRRRAAASCSADVDLAAHLARRRCTRCAAASRSCSRTRTARSIRGAPSATRSSRGR